MRIFDEYPDSDIPDDVRHHKRVKLEPLIFDVLKKKYSAKLDEFWDANGPSVSSDRCIFIIERRIHENLDFCLKCAAYFGKGWSIAFICSDANIEYCKTIAGKHSEKVFFLPYFIGNPDRDTARLQYNSLLKNSQFYKSLPWSNLIIMQTDSYIRKPIPDSILKYDIIGAPATWDLSTMVGGFSYRNRDAMIRICEEYKEDIPSEDLFLDNGAKKLDLRRPSYVEAMEFVSESALFDDPIALHQWWTFFYKTIEDGEEFFHNFLRLEIV